MSRISVMQLTDTLCAGGLERVAVNLANGLASDHHSHLCVTRQSGPLEKIISGRVKQLHLDRSGRFDMAAICALARYIHQNQIEILHAHGTSLFIAAATRVLQPQVKVVWHDHFGRFETDERPAGIYRAAAIAVDAVVSVTESLANWARKKIGLRADRVWYIPNFASLGDDVTNPACDLPGTKGSRVVCVANLRPQKDHLNLLRAFDLVVCKVPAAHLILIGAGINTACVRAIRYTTAELRLRENVTWLESRSDVRAILNNCDIGVLSSQSEGLPLALIEYGLANLAVVSTNVGQCAEVLDHGKAGFLVAPCSPQTLANALLALLQSPAKRKEYADNFSRRVQEHYSAASVLEKICGIYDVVLRGT